MGIAAAMKDMTQEIASSSDARMVEVRRLIQEANEMLDSFKASHKKMGAQLRKDLARDRAEMETGVKATRSGFQSSHKEMSLVLGKDLAEHTQAVRDEVARLCHEMGVAHQNMSAKLRKDLARKPEVPNMLGGFQRSHNQMAKALRKELTDNDRRIKSEVAGMRRETKTDLGEARAAWQGLTRGVEKATVKTTPKIEKEQVLKAGSSGEGTPLEARLLAIVGEHPEGITLAEVGKSLGVAPVFFGRAAKKLVDEGKVRKEDRAYFLAPAE